MPVLENLVVDGKPIPGVVIFSFANTVERGQGPALLAKTLSVMTPIQTCTAMSPETSSCGEHFIFRCPIEWAPARNTISIGDSDVLITTSDSGGDLSFLSEKGTTAHSPGRPDLNLKTISDVVLLAKLPDDWLAALSRNRVAAIASKAKLTSTTAKVAASILVVGAVGALAVSLLGGDDKEPERAAAPAATTTALPSPSTTEAAPFGDTIIDATATTKSSPNSGSSSVSSSSDDLAFIQTLSDFDVPFSSAKEAISVAHLTCNSIRKSSNKARAIDDVVEIAMDSAGYSVPEAYAFVGTSVFAYCPEFNSYILN